MGVKLLNLPGCVSCYHEDGLDCRKCLATNLNGVLLHFYCILSNAVFIVRNSSEDAGLLVKPLLPFFCVTSLSSRITMNDTHDVLWLLFPVLAYKSVVRGSGVKKDMCKFCFQMCGLNIHVKI
jgi:hypothetical protein